MKILRIVAVLFAVLAVPAGATYSVVGADTSNNQVGGAITSCVPQSNPLWLAIGSAPGNGIIITQATLNVSARANGQVALLNPGRPPPEAVLPQLLTAFDADAGNRQYAMVDTLGRTAAFTGWNDVTFAGDLQGDAGTFVYSVQGNTLSDGLVLPNASAGFAAGGCDLAARLMNALESGAMNGQGDKRCTDGGRPSSQAYIQVDRATGVPGDYLALDAYTDIDAGSPLALLRRKFNDWRVTHPCPGTEVDAGAPEDAGVMMCICIPDAGPGGGAGGGTGTGGGSAGGSATDAGCEPDMKTGCSASPTGIGMTWVAFALMALRGVGARRRHAR